MRRLAWYALLAVVSALAIAAIATPFRLGAVPSASPLAPGPARSLDPAQVPLASGVQPWRPELCPPQPEPSGAQGSDLTFEGTCAFHQAGPLACHTLADDFYANLRRTLPGGQTMTLYANVEGYLKPGSYRETVQELLLIADGDSLYRWSNYHASMTVGPGAGSGTLPRTELRPEPGTGTTGTVTVAGGFVCSRG